MHIALQRLVWVTAWWVLFPMAGAQVLDITQFQQQVWKRAEELPTYYELQVAQASIRISKLSQLPSLSLVSEPLNINRQNVLRYNAVIDADEYRTQQLIRNSLGVRITQPVDVLGGTLSVQSDLSRLQSTTGPTEIRNYGWTPFQVGWTQDWSTRGVAKFNRDALALSLNLAQEAHLEAVAEEYQLVSLVYLEAWALQSAIASTRMRLAQRDTLLEIVERQLARGFSNVEQRLLMEQLILEDSLQLVEQEGLFQDLCNTLFDHTDLELTPLYGKLVPPLLPQTTYLDADRIGAFLETEGRAGNREQALIISAERERKLRQAARLPQVSVYAGLGVNRFTDVPWWQSQQAFIPQQYLNFQVNVPIWSWGIPTIKILQSDAEIGAARARIQQETLLEHEKMLQLVHAYNRTTPKLQLLTRLSDIRSEKYRITLSKWASGQTSMQEVYDHTQLWKQSETQYYNLLKETWNAYLTLQTLLLKDPVTLAPFSPNP